MATERRAREQAAADLRQLQCTAAALALLHGGKEGSRWYRELEAALREAANGTDQTQLTPGALPKRRRRI